MKKVQEMKIIKYEYDSVDELASHSDGMIMIGWKVKNFTFEGLNAEYYMTLEEDEK